jgi:hypothetical protein
MLFAVELPGDEHAAALDVLARVQHWHCPPGRKYLTAEADITHPLLAGAARAFFIKMTPGAQVHRHRDPPGVVDFYDTDHIVCSTNDRAFICWEDERGSDQRQHLWLGRRYRIVDRGVVHWAVNEGDTDRIHLLIEYPKI